MLNSQCSIELRDVKLCDAIVAEQNYKSWLHKISKKTITLRQAQGDNNSLFTISYSPFTIHDSQ
jgi:hypothetical protein